MTYSPVVTETYSTTQQGSRSGTTVDFIVIHHAALFDLDTLIYLETGGKEVSSHIGIQDGRIAGIVTEENRAWSLADAPWDSRSLTVETCNSTGAPDWLISDVSYHSLALVVADWCKRYGIPLSRSRIIGHREVNSIYHASYATACPGGINLDRVVAEAAAVGAVVTKESDMTLRLVTGAFVPQQPAPVGPYDSNNRGKTGGNYLIVNGETGKSSQVFGSQEQIDILGGFIAGGTQLVKATSQATAQQNYDWLMKQLNLVSVSAVGGCDRRQARSALRCHSLRSHCRAEEAR